MSAFIDTFYKSFSSAVPSSSSGSDEKHPSERIPVYSEMQILKITAPKQDLDKFTDEIIHISESAAIGVDIKRIYPSRRHEERLKRLEEEEKKNHDFLDYMFSDTIPFLHDFLVYGSPEAHFFHIRGKKGELDIFNQLCTQVIHGRELQCKVEVTDRRKISVKKQVKNSILGGPNSKPDLLDSIFSDDLSGCNPLLHSMILSF